MHKKGSQVPQNSPTTPSRHRKYIYRKTKISYMKWHNRPTVSFSAPLEAIVTAPIVGGQDQDKVMVSY